MKDQVLSIEQMQKLKELGVDITNASMHWQYIPTANNIMGKDDSEELALFVSEKYKMGHNYPTFTLQDMIELMPSKVKYEGHNYYLYIDKNIVSYIDDMDIENCILESDNNILKNTYKVLIWLAKHKYI